MIHIRHDHPTGLAVFHPRNQDHLIVSRLQMQSPFLTALIWFTTIGIIGAVFVHKVGRGDLVTSWAASLLWALTNIYIAASVGLGVDRWILRKFWHPAIPATVIPKDPEQYAHQIAAALADPVTRIPAETALLCLKDDPGNPVALAALNRLLKPLDPPARPLGPLLISADG